MQPFARVEGRVVPLDRPNVDTDQIIPKQFLKRIERSGYGPFLFHDWRYLAGGSTENPDFELNAPGYRGAPVLLAGRNFGCGSSREHAVWALLDYGIRAVIAPSFSDIFTANALKAGLLPVCLPTEVVTRWLDAVKEAPGTTAIVDLQACTVELAGERQSIEIDGEARRRLLGGLDEIALTLDHEAEIADFEARRPSWLPVAAAVGRAGETDAP